MTHALAAINQRSTAHAQRESDTDSQTLRETKDHDEKHTQEQKEAHTRPSSHSSLSRVYARSWALLLRFRVHGTTYVIGY